MPGSANQEFESLVRLHGLTYSHPGSGLKLLRYYNTATAALQQFDPDHIRLPGPVMARLQQRNLPQSLAQLDADLEWQYQHDQRRIITIFDPAYPQLLKEIPDPPLCLFLWGDESRLRQDQIAVVGSRKPTQQGVRIAETFANALGAAGITVTSGMAYGIDAAAHRGAMETAGKTIAVQGCGADMIYPRGHERLAKKILEQGLIVSEFPTGTGAFPQYFPQRNRIVTGLGLGTLVVEAAIKSGSLISARLAMEQGREVFAVPGSVFAPQSEGCHQLISQGAKLTTSVADIIEELPGYVLEPGVAPEPDLDEEGHAILQHLSGEAVSIDRLHELSDIPLSTLMTRLVELEVEGLVQANALGYVLARPA